MILKKWLRNSAMVGVLVIPLMLTGCGFLSKTSEAIDPPQDEQGVDSPTSWLQQNEGGTNHQIYLKDRNGYLAPIALPVVLDDGEVAGKQLLELMVDGGLYAAMMPGEFRALIPQGTEVLSFEVSEEKLATVNFSELFVSYNEADERAIVEAIVYTLTSLDEIEAVSIQVNGETLAEMPVAGYPLAKAIDRSIGINIEMAPGVAYSQAAPITLYFSAQTLGAEQYFVPVTRMINREQSKVVAAIAQLGKGPLDSTLTPVMMPDVEVVGYDIYDDVLHVDLQDAAYESGVFVPSEMLNAMILSLLDSTGVEAVQLRVNGDINLFDENNTSYSEPVSKPEYVNAIKL